MTVNMLFHHVNVFGIIDRDYRTDEEILGLEQLRIYTIDVAEIENILLNESTLRIVADHLHLDPDEVVGNALKMAREMSVNDIERQVSLRVCRVVENGLSRINNKSIGLEAIKLTVSEIIGGLDIEGIYNEYLSTYSRISLSGSLDEILKYFNNKGLLSNVCATFELGRNGYEKLVLRLLNSDKRDQIIDGLRKYVPSI